MWRNSSVQTLPHRLFLNTLKITVLRRIMLMHCAPLTINASLFTPALPHPFSFSILIRLIRKVLFIPLFFLQNLFIFSHSTDSTATWGQGRHCIKPPLVCHLQWLTHCLDAVNQIRFLGAILKSEGDGTRIIKWNLNICVSLSPHAEQLYLSTCMQVCFNSNKTFARGHNWIDWPRKIQKNKLNYFAGHAVKKCSCFHHSPCCFW